MCGVNMNSFEDEIEKIIGELTLDEKIAMIHGAGLFRTGEVDRLGIPPLVTSDGPMGVRNEFFDKVWKTVSLNDDFVTYSPSNSALAATWNPECAMEGGRVLGSEARGRGKDVILAPGINIKRDPLCGRNFEYMSEDPYLVSSIAVPFIKGIQENDVAACVKHFAANCQETDRLAVDTIVDERTLNEIYFPGFKAAVQDAKSLTIMNAYNRLNGPFCGESKPLLDDVLRDKWGYDGTVISDWGSIHNTKDCAETSMDIEMSVATNYDDYCLANPLKKAILAGEIKEEVIDKKITNILRLMYRLKMMGPEAVNRKTGEYASMEHAKKVYEVAKESIVLLKNEDQVLPITADRLAKKPEEGKLAPTKRKIAIIGCNANQQHANGGGSGEIKAIYEVAPILGIKKALGGNVTVSYAKGYFIPDKKDVNEINWQESSLERQIMGNVCPEQVDKELMDSILASRKELRDEAVELAKNSDEVIFVGGLNHDYDSEGRDRDDMRLPYGQNELIEALLEVKPNTIITIVAGSPLEFPWLDKAKAVIWSYYAGMEGGDALGDIIVGRVNPSGKLPESFPKAYTDTVTYKNGQFGLMDRIELKEGIFYGYRYYEKEGIEVNFPFGYGKSYSNFQINNVKYTQFDNRGMKEVVLKVEADVFNDSDVDGAEVVQCYIGDCECSVPRPVKELKGYAKVFVKAHESAHVTIDITRDALAFYDVTVSDFVVEPGEFVAYVGNSSRDCNLTYHFTVLD